MSKARWTVSMHKSFLSYNTRSGFYYHHSAAQIAAWLGCSAWGVLSKRRMAKRLRDLGVTDVNRLARLLLVGEAIVMKQDLRAIEAHAAATTRPVRPHARRDYRSRRVYLVPAHRRNVPFREAS